MPVATVTTSAGTYSCIVHLFPADHAPAGSLALLKDEDRDVRVYALEYLLSIVPQFWAEISEELPFM